MAKVQQRTKYQEHQDPARTLLVLFHGLEGSSASHYARDLAAFAAGRGFDFVVPHFRGCSGEPNWTARAYHSGDFQEVAWILARLRSQHGGRMLAVGVSLGGNALLRWAEEMGTQASQVVQALAAVSAPVDLSASGQSIDAGLNQLFYTRRFLDTMKPKALAKLERFPGLFDRQALERARTLFEFDDAFTAPVHGFDGAWDYWKRASAKPLLHQIRLPTLLLNEFAAGRRGGRLRNPVATGAGRACGICAGPGGWTLLDGTSGGPLAGPTRRSEWMTSSSKL